MSSYPVFRFLLLAPFFSFMSFAQQSDSASAGIVARQTLVMTKPPEHVPSGTVVDGPIMGNGDVGVAIGGPPEQQRFYIGKNDFWSKQASPLTVGGVQLTIPGLDGASYREEEDLFHAEVRGTFKSAKTTVHTTSWVTATENLLVTKLEADYGSGLEVNAALFPAGAAIRNDDKTVNIGREQHGQGRWYFSGMIDEVHLYDRVLDQGEVSQLVNLEEPAKGLIRRWAFDAQEGTTPQDTVAKLVTGPACPATTLCLPTQRASCRRDGM